MNKEQLDNIKAVFQLYPEIKLVYFFGSKATGEGGTLSDYEKINYDVVYDVLRNKLKDVEELLGLVQSLLIREPYNSFK